MAIVILFVWLVLSGRFAVPPKKISYLFGTGVLTFLYWTLIVLATKLSNEAVCLIGLATLPLFISVLKPILAKGTMSIGEIITGLNAIFGIYIIYSSDFDYGLGFLIALAAAFFGAMLTIFNAELVQDEHSAVITFYQMIGACITAFLLLIWSDVTDMFIVVKWYVSLKDFLLILGLTLALSVYAYSESIGLMRYLSAFTIGMVGNLAPLYGIACTVIYYWLTDIQQIPHMDIYFYGGSVILFSAVIARPLVSWFFEKRYLEN